MGLENGPFHLDHFFKKNHLHPEIFEEIKTFLNKIQYPYSLENRPEGEFFTLSSVIEDTRNCPLLPLIEKTYCSFNDYLREKIVKWNIFKSIEDASINKNPLEIQLLNSAKKVHLYPCRLVILDGYFTLIGENMSTKTLFFTRSDEIVSLKDLPTEDYCSNFSPFEIDDFIIKMRGVAESEERIVLKIISTKEFNLSPSFHHWGRPYLTTNLEGDMIWASSVEVSEKLFQWLYDNKENFEIIDPIYFKEILDRYCEFREILYKNFYKKGA